MRQIRITEEVWKEIAKRGTFGETEDDVLRRVFGIEAAISSPGSGQNMQDSRTRGRHATIRMSARVENNKLVVDFVTGKRKEWRLPSRDDKLEIRRVRDDAVAFALAQGASDPGQTNAVRKALTDAGYHLTK